MIHHSVVKSARGICQAGHRFLQLAFEKAFGVSQFGVEPGVVEGGKIGVAYRVGTASSSDPHEDSIQAELADFGRAIGQGAATPDGSPAEALQDVAIIEAMLLSARTGSIVRPEKVI